MVLHVRGTVLPEREERSLWIDGGVLREDHAAAGVLLIRAPGAAARIPGWAHDAEGLPRVRSAGPWLATPGRFFPGWGRHVSEAELARAAVEEAAAALEAAQDAAPAGRGPETTPGSPPAAVATSAAPSTTAAAVADSLEHGMHLDSGLLDQMAAQGTALVPTLGAFAASAFRVRAGDPGPR